MGKADPVRKLKLLWGRGLDVKHGPRPGLSIDTLLAAAMEIADAAGLDKLTIRKLAQRLDVAPMSIYTYVADKAELLELMADRALLPLAAKKYRQRKWQTRVREIARANLKLYLAHPWLLEVSNERPVLGPGTIGKYERELEALEDLSLTDLEQDSALTFLLNYVRAAAADQLRSQRLARESGSNAQWWREHAAVLAELIPQADYPLASRVGTAAGEAHQGAADAGEDYFFGLELVIAGLANLIDKP